MLLAQPSHLSTARPHSLNTSPLFRSLFSSLNIQELDRLSDCLSLFHSTRQVVRSSSYRTVTIFGRLLALITMTVVKFPRRYHQRRNIHKPQSTTLLKGRASHSVPQAKGARSRKETKTAGTSSEPDSDSESNSDSASDYRSDSEYKSNDDSGYSSSSSYNEVTETYKEMRA
jgi:hypothetical protein